MFDSDTLIVTYDRERGEARGSRGRNVDYKAKGLGDCVDCGICVQVCSTGIDIRNGLQYECIGCAACIDGCDQVMDKMGYPRGLIRYATQSGMDGVEIAIEKLLSPPLWEKRFGTAPGKTSAETETGCWNKCRGVPRSVARASAASRCSGRR
jgi:polyferredoxin